jgi:hypothetical protein
MTSILVPACAVDSQPGDELANESTGDGDVGKGDAAGDGLYGFFKLSADDAGFVAAPANQATTRCTRGPAQRQCTLMSIDWTGTAMPESVAKGYEDGLRKGTPLLVRGDIVPAPDDRGVSFAVTEVWVGSHSDPADGVFTLVVDNGIRCVRAPCPSLTEKKLNSTLSAQISSLDLEASGADREAIDRAYEALSGSGLVVVGYRYYDAAGGKARTANNFFTKAPVPLY